ncbi:MAG: hypothetical protein Q4G59_05440 [Planctomycetia bacterium]|nr:hypothetical protein [Planctomycetia bacterium]
MTSGSTLSGSLAITKRTDGTGGDLSVDGTLRVNRDGEMIDIQKRKECYAGTIYS